MTGEISGLTSRKELLTAGKHFTEHRVRPMLVRVNQNRLARELGDCQCLLWVESKGIVAGIARSEGPGDSERLLALAPPRRNLPAPSLRIHTSEAFVAPKTSRLLNHGCLALLLGSFGGALAQPMPPTLFVWIPLGHHSRNISTSAPPWYRAYERSEGPRVRVYRASRLVDDTGLSVPERVALLQKPMPQSGKRD